jgi:4-hydroxybenzoate polyprenyltransferase
MATITQRWMGRGNTVKESYSPSEKLAGLADITRPILTFMGALGVASAAALAYRGFPRWDLCLAGFLAAILAYSGIHAFNDYIDSRRDIECWPGRPIPSNRLSREPVLLFSIFTFMVSLTLIWIFFNPVCFIFSSVTILLGCLYSAYLRDRIGYLVLPPIQGMLWLCGWTAFSPETIFSSWMPWILYFFSASWQAWHIMVYSPLHPIQKIRGLKLTQVPALFIKTSPQTAVNLGLIFLLITLGMAIFAGFYGNLGITYLIPVISVWAFALIINLRFVKDPGNFAKGIKAFTSATYFMLAARLSILLSIFILFS